VTGEERGVAMPLNPSSVSNPFSISLNDLFHSFAGPNWPQVIDVCGAEDYAANARDIPGSIHRSEAEFETWVSTLDRKRPVVISCQKGHKISQGIVARMRADGWQASALTGGFVGWAKAELPLLQRQALVDVGVKEGSLWVTRRRPKIDRAACPWLIKRFIDPASRFLYVEPDQVVAVAERTGGIPYDIPGVHITHDGDECSFDTLMKIAGLNGHEPLDCVAAIVRGADNARFDLAPEAAGLLAISLGLSDLAGDDDHAMLRSAFIVYDGLYAWAARAANETHNWPPKA
jgi:rhodanese-related sulfurtransferase